MFDGRIAVAPEALESQLGGRFGGSAGVGGDVRRASVVPWHLLFASPGDTVAVWQKRVLETGCEVEYSGKAGQ